MSTRVPNKFPTITGVPYRIAIIGEAPGRDEEIAGQPFCGASGRFLYALLARAGIQKDACFVGNICQVRPPANEIKAFDWHSDEVQEGMAQLTLDLRQFKPHLVVLMGNTALKAAKDPTSPYGKSYAHSIMNWRGSLFVVDHLDSPMFGMKCMATYHPSYVLRDYSVAQVLQLDLKRAAVQGQSPTLYLPKRDLIIPKTYNECVTLLQDLLDRKPKVACDIEGYVDDMWMISFADSANRGFAVPFIGNHDGSFCETIEEEMHLWRLLSQVLMDPDIKKILQNSLYDRFVLQYSYDIVVRGVVDDTMLKHWELFCELEKSLGFQASIYTYEPYYKEDRTSDSLQTRLEYGIRDSCVTYEISAFQDKMLTNRSHYEFNLALLEPILYMELRGIRYNTELAKQKLHETERALYKLQHTLNVVADKTLIETADAAKVFIRARELMCYKKAITQIEQWDDFAQWVKVDYVNKWQRVRELSNLPQPWPDDVKGELSYLLDYKKKTDSDLPDWSLNIGSAYFKFYVYNVLKLPLQTNDDGNPTTDYFALLTLWKKTGNPVCDLALQLQELKTRAKMLRIHADPDGRIRCGYNIVGTETGRITCYTSPTGSGYNLQTIPKDNELRPIGHPLHKGMRDLFLADEGYEFFECDLAGADSWTVASYCVMLGDPTMMDDLKSGGKPARNLALMYMKGAEVNALPREELNALGKREVKKESWQYFACKIGTHGTSYQMGAQALAKHIFIQSEGAVNLTTAQAETIQKLFFIRYKGVKKWHEFTENAVKRKSPYAHVSPSGHKRIFFGRPDEISGEVLANEPQENTTYATNRFLLNLWLDPENKTEDGRLRVEPLHQVHDAGCGQWPKEIRDWAVGKVRSWFNNPMVIAQQNVLIPFEGAFGKSWGETGKEYGGGSI